MNRAEILAEIKLRRSALGADELRVRERSAVLRLLSELEKWESSREGSSRPVAIALYRSAGHEVDLDTLEEWCSTREWRMHYPRVTDPTLATMEFVWVPEPFDERWSKGSVGIFEPETARPAISADALDLILVPGVAFGEDGSRMGRGKGYYDRALARIPRVSRWALTLDLHVFPAIPTHPHDQKMNAIVTESRKIEACRDVPV